MSKPDTHDHKSAKKILPPAERDARIAELEAELAELKAQNPEAYVHQEYPKWIGSDEDGNRRLVHTADEEHAAGKAAKPAPKHTPEEREKERALRLKVEAAHGTATPGEHA